jgi:hypothetical protein
MNRFKGASDGASDFERALEIAEIVTPNGLKRDSRHIVQPEMKRLSPRPNLGPQKGARTTVF